MRSSSIHCWTENGQMGIPRISWCTSNDSINGIVSCGIFHEDTLWDIYNYHIYMWFSCKSMKMMWWKGNIERIWENNQWDIYGFLQNIGLQWFIYMRGQFTRKHVIVGVLISIFHSSHGSPLSGSNGMLDLWCKWVQSHPFEPTG